MSAVLKEVNVQEKQALPANHGGAQYAKTRGANKKADKRYDAKSSDFNAFIKQGKIGNGWRDSSGYTKPGSRKKVH